MNPMLKDITELCTALESGTVSPALSRLIRDSLYYYCSGKDATPVSVFGAGIPLYVYSDSFVYMRTDFDGAASELYRNIKKMGNTLEYRRQLSSTGFLRQCERAEITLWSTDTQETFALLYTKSDAIKCFSELYVNDNDGITPPKCFCNYRYEMPRRGILEQAEKRAQFILGHCFDSSFRPVGEYDYMGDYKFGSSKTKVTLYERSRD